MSNILLDCLAFAHEQSAPWETSAEDETSIKDEISQQLNYQLYENWWPSEVIIEFCDTINPNNK